MQVFYERLFAIIHLYIGVCAISNRTFATSVVWSTLYFFLPHFTGCHYLNLKDIGLFAVAKLERWRIVSGKGGAFLPVMFCCRGTGR